MLTLIFDPLLGEATPDGRAEEVITTLLEHSKTQDLERTIGSALVIEHLRLKLAQGHAKPEDVVVMYQGEDLGLDGEGQFKCWPAGFCDHQADVLLALLRAQC